MMKTVPGEQRREKNNPGSLEDPQASIKGNQGGGRTNGCGTTLK